VINSTSFSIFVGFNDAFMGSILIGGGGNGINCLLLKELVDDDFGVLVLNDFRDELQALFSMSILIFEKKSLLAGTGGFAKSIY
jgi:hypothetical protein